jgi:predicted  nucleic acid-binding Zn-ribbon protein
MIYIKKHWIIVVLILIVWGITLHIVFNKRIKDGSEPHHIINPKTDSILAAVDSVVTVIKMQKEAQNKSINQLNEQKKEVEKKFRKKNKEIEKLKKQKPKVEKVVVEKEVIVEREVIKENPSTKEENYKLKKELDGYRETTKNLTEENINLKSKKVYVDTIAIDTTHHRRKRRFLLF